MPEDCRSAINTLMLSQPFRCSQKDAASYTAARREARQVADGADRRRAMSKDFRLADDR